LKQINGSSNEEKFETLPDKDKLKYLLNVKVSDNGGVSTAEHFHLN
jgi:hypothetical protein